MNRMDREFCAVRSLTERLAAPLSAEDQTVQSMPDASPTKWHRAHTTWFFETFVLGPDHPPYDERFGFLFNSYYEAVGPRHARPERGLITRPGITEIAEYRRHVDAAVLEILDGGVAGRTAELIELGLHHEQQHQELLVMDIHHALSRNPLRSPYGELPWPGAAPRGPSRRGSTMTAASSRSGMPATVSPSTTRGRATAVLLRPFRIAGSPVTCGDWLAFVADGGYRRPDSVDVRRLVHRPGPRLGGAPVLGA